MVHLATVPSLFIKTKKTKLEVEVYMGLVGYDAV
jgi:hypothetical protein